MIRSLLLLSISASTLACAGTTSRLPAPDSGDLSWTGRFASSMERSSSVRARALQHSEGRVTLTETRDGKRMRAHVYISSPDHTSTALRWAVLPGQCGSAAFPVLSYQQFPFIEMSTNGRGELSAELPMTLDVSETYHVNVYKGSGVQVSDVLSCTNLRLR
jgi:hypothetical protein